ncbi:MAG TPA: DUF5652 family protein [Patescibacteria group bacterium]|nr:DUF5652 family protein [Patescibacteria group bacterium]
MENDLRALVSAFMGLFVVLVIWSAIWKAVALWYAARNGDKVWYVLLIILNTVGILEIIYIFAVHRRKQDNLTQPGPASNNPPAQM